MDKIKKPFLKFAFIFYMVLSAFFILNFNFAFSQEAPLQIDIMGGNIQAMPIAISYFSIENDLKELKLQNNIPNLIAENLVNSGLFKLLNRDAYMQNPEQLNITPLSFST